MSRFSHYDTDDERLPDGMIRVGYDADTQVYTFQDTSDGSYWESAPGNQYGQLTRVGDGQNSDDDDTEPFLLAQQTSNSQASWRAELMPLLNFGVLIGLCLLLLFWYLHIAAAPPDRSEAKVPKIACPDSLVAYTIHQGDTCWDIAKNHDISVEELERFNPKVECKKLRINSAICVSKATEPV